MDPTLTELLHSNLQWIFVGGKGGVGKTTTSCALATLFATTPISDAAAPDGTRPRRVLLISTDPAHNLSDAFNQRFGPQPTPVKGLEDTLAAMEVDPKNFTHGALMSSLTGANSGGSASSLSREAEADAVEQTASFARIGAVLKEAARTMPGIDEISVFAEILQYVRTLSYDLLIFDTAPTGHTLRLLALPQTLNSTFDRLMSLEGLAPMLEAASHLIGSSFGATGGDSVSGCEVATATPSSSSTAPGAGSAATGSSQGSWSITADEVRAKALHWRQVMEEVQVRFNDPSRTSFVCVCIAEFLSVYETERLVQELMKYNIGCDSIVVNQLVLKPSSEPPCRMCAARQKIQTKYLEQIDLLYDDFHVVKMPLLSDEVRGVPALKMFARFLQEPYNPDTHGYIDVQESC
ncbi:Anion-transporting ATPase/CobQ/CobB/MinD/ParA nucleotide binding domain [Leishmania naiffi]|uniref:ATPase ASNA1 homolog n=1 Tax=Leishmania naiffi TaxID=5678 RepID=A0AAW3C1G5_9TRYP